MYEVLVLEKKEVAYLEVRAGVRYWEDGKINGVDDENGTLTPCRDGKYWCPNIELSTGRITNWIEGKEADIHYKVCDDGLYTLLDKEGNNIVKKEGYVPNIMCPKEDGYGDYIIMDIDKNGIIQNWKVNIEDFGFQTDEDY